MNWVSYTECFEDGYCHVTEDHIMGLLRNIGTPREFKSVTSLMLEFTDGSFIRFESEGKK